MAPRESGQQAGASCSATRLACAGAPCLLLLVASTLCWPGGEWLQTMLRCLLLAPPSGSPQLRGPDAERRAAQQGRAGVWQRPGRRHPEGRPRRPIRGGGGRSLARPGSAEHHAGLPAGACQRYCSSLQSRGSMSAGLLLRWWSLAVGWSPAVEEVCRLCRLCRLPAVQFDSGFAHGMGQYTSVKGRVYRGEWTSGLRHGWAGLGASPGTRFRHA